MAFQTSILCLFLTTTVFAMTENKPPSISVQGSCVRSVMPDQTEVSVGIRAFAPTAAEAAAKTAPVYERLLQKVKSLNLKKTELETTDLGVEINYVWERDKQVRKGFVAFYAFSVITGDLERTTEIFKIAKELGANQVIGPRPRLSKKLYKSEYELCLDEAVKNARKKADVIATSLGVEVNNKAILDEREDYDHVYERLTVSGTTKSFAPTIAAKKQDVTVKINATFLIQ